MMIGIQKRCFTLNTVMAAKQQANPQAVTRMGAKIFPGRLPNCQAKTAAKR
jgi:hypothetical protein